MSDLIPSSALEGLTELIKKAGRDPEDLAKRTRIPVSALYAPDVLVRTDRYNALLELAAMDCKDRFVGLKLANLRNFDILGAVWLMARHGKTVGRELQLITENIPLLTSSVTTYISREGVSGHLLVFEFTGPIAASNSTRTKGTPLIQMTELCLAQTCKELRLSLGAQWFPDYVQFRHAAPSELGPLQRIFGHRVFFNQDVNAIHITNEDFSHPSYRNIDDSISTEAIARTRRDLEAKVGSGESFNSRVSRIMLLLINDAGCSAGEVASLLNMSERVLRYRLKKSNTSYQVLYDRVRGVMAKSYLTNSDLSISAVAERLHFTDTAAFSNFFKRHTSQSPRDYARAHAKSGIGKGATYT